MNRIVPSLPTHVTHSKRESVNVSKLRILKFLLSRSSWVICAPCNHKGPHQGEARRLEAEEDGTTEAEVGMGHLEDGRRGHKPRGIGGL